MELLLGWAVIMIALIITCGPILWMQYKHTPLPLSDEDTQPTDPHTINGYVSPFDDTTQIIILEPMIIDTRPAPVTDLLGEWKPWEHTPSEPVLLGHVLTEQQWETFGTSELAVLRA